MFYRISEFANKLGVSSSTLRNWEKRGWLKPHHVTPSGYRYYSEEQYEQFLKRKTKQEGGEQCAEGD